MAGNGRDPGYYADYARNLRTLSKAQLDAAGASLVKPEELTWIVIGDLAKIEAGVRELGLGEVIVLDADGKPRAVK